MVFGPREKNLFFFACLSELSDPICQPRRSGLFFRIAVAFPKMKYRFPLLIGLVAILFNQYGWAWLNQLSVANYGPLVKIQGTGDLTVPFAADFITPPGSGLITHASLVCPVTVCPAGDLGEQVCAADPPCGFSGPTAQVYRVATNPSVSPILGTARSVGRWLKVRSYPSVMCLNHIPTVRVI